MLCSLLTCTGLAFAQTFGDKMGALKEIGFNPNMVYAAGGLLVLIVAFYIFIFFFRKIQKAKQPDMLSGITYLDVSGMGKQGLLTPEEMTRVRQSMSRQLAQKKSSLAIGGMPGELALMADPEVQRLEAIAQEKARQQRSDSIQQEKPPVAPRNENYDDVLFPRKQEFPDVVDPLDIPLARQDEDVQLPADVVKMAELGLISPEEVARIKDRIRQKRNQL